MSDTDHLKSDLTKLFQGKAVPVTNVDISNERSDSFEPVTKNNVGYIVSAVIINDVGQILMMQEAKYSCYGTWYLPAGRMEQGENLQEAVMREVEEETGLTFQPTSLIAVEFGCGTWYRFNFIGHVTGGKLKTLEEKDKESLQAEWIDFVNIKTRTLKLRSPDIIPLINIARKYHSLGEDCRHPHNMPALVPYNRLIHRVMLVHCSFGGDILVLTTNKEGLHLPTCYISPFDFSFKITVFAVIKEAFGASEFQLKMKGLISVEHQGAPASNKDGLCLTTLQVLDGPETEPPPRSDSTYQWVSLTQLDSDLGDQLATRLKENGCVPLIDL
ncbi:8-oxo-dGDP phosphatase NUDT18-like isoform X2 [Mizuhopecten yessoensis]|uniref:8-oxo-dGDP phosphatase NUDT18 n=1 Tax=Mizuhopecten yessoensis TaxID=6573 RepID=A0A210QN95_MIZYE|nr:8-oxo-dGDP phosphatase NUDT18-like isoform X2 [Mizuhopecten yessoensis]XP_021353990.1 8-oxo-dGDP phosphatase NUDT18-like isoform X2 [Mizuhopecten yessoensis]XP_021353991.1 8-oxo-dGDP phosphatase NUDT18-like isoform X2 [Mizuhopecten yessoensis]XP_021353992.1 8-oxo-dGDP phosphatase NUDT18-like isoform X2 [Mizuhopecten yessoensis]XP_021353993.1 8-oxo-dGDP phosphatase NUDT18-like isoform X2 [Mizuhopecten yessoensis]XP_021353994.1 8-oxo-dGDP phosphatase NUDT18-like isoform X2 [Mizuhopecten yesso